MLIYEALKADHDNVKELLNKLINLGEKENKTALITQIRDELIPHSRAEETVLYNSLRVVDAAKGVVMHSYQEHIEAEALLRTLQMMDKIDVDWKKTAQKLKDALEHHIAEEEGKVFEAAKQVFTDEEAAMMGRAFQELKSEVKDEGFIKTTFDLLVNLMPPRFTPQQKNFNTDLRL